jgi:hypothetical protein
MRFTRGKFMLRQDRVVSMFTLRLCTYFVPFCLMMVLGVVSAAVTVVYPAGYPDSFAPYEGFMTGQGAPTIDTTVCIPQWQGLFTHQWGCSLRPASGSFQEVHLMLGDTTHGWKRQITFWPRHLCVVDLVRHWGAPDRVVIIDSKMHNYRLMWDDANVEAYATSARRFTNQASVSLVQWTF